MKYSVEFDPSVGKYKPYTLANDPCPFCAPHELSGIIEERNDMIWLENKFPTMHKSWSTVIVETADCNADLASYEQEKLHDVIRFGVEKWLETSQRREFQSVIFYRNFGPNSGGSIRHPHSQIIGFEKYDYKRDAGEENFVGHIIYRDSATRVTLSKYPICGFAEYNVTLQKDGDLESFADHLQKIVRYVRFNNLHPCDSYNIFFYQLHRIHVKIIPRFISSPLYLGYVLPLVIDKPNAKELIDNIKKTIYT